jgi:hypothetical protein
MKASDMPVISHVTSALFLIGFLIFCWMIYKKTRKVHRRGVKAKRRMKKAGF